MLLAHAIVEYNQARRRFGGGRGNNRSQPSGGDGRFNEPFGNGNGSDEGDAGFPEPLYNRTNRVFNQDRNKFRSNYNNNDRCSTEYQDQKPREFYIPEEENEEQLFNSGISSGINFSNFDYIPVRVRSV